MSWRRTHPFVHADADPAVRFLLDRLQSSTTYSDGTTEALEIEAGLGADTIRHWRYKLTPNSRGPHIKTLRQALNALGYDLAVVDLKTGSVV